MIVFTPLNNVLQVKGEINMRKKIKDLTIEETINTCKRQYDCYSCPLQRICAELPIQYKNEDLEKEIEL